MLDKTEVVGKRTIVLDPDAGDLWNGKLLEEIRKRPAAFLGTHTLTGLWHFLDGVELAERLRGADPTRTFRGEMNDWVNHRLHPASGKSPVGYAGLILEEVPDEPAALAKFFELYEEWLEARCKGDRV